VAEHQSVIPGCYARKAYRQGDRGAQSRMLPAAQVMDAPVLGEEDELMERRTLNQITNRTRRGDLVLYFHSKGVSSRRVNQEPGARRPLWMPPRMQDAAAATNGGWHRSALVPCRCS